MKNTDKSSVGRKYPNLSPRAMAWLLLTAAVIGGEHSVADDAYAGEIVKKEQAKVTPPRADAKKFKNWKINPKMDAAEWNKKIDEIEPYIVANMILHEGVYEKVYRDGKGHIKGTPTIGIGFIISDAEHKNFAKKILGRSVDGKNFRISYAESIKLMLAWVREKICPNIKRGFKGDIDARLFISLVVAAYNKGPNIFNTGNSGAAVRNAVNKGIRGRELANLYVRTFAPERKTRWPGLKNKYAVAALYYLGAVSNDAVLDAASAGAYGIELAVTEYYNGKLPKNTDSGNLIIYDKKGKAIAFLGPKTINKMLAGTNEYNYLGERQKKIRKYMTKTEVKKIRAGELFNAKAEKTSPIKSKMDKKTNKKRAFNDASKKLRNNAHSVGFDLSRLVFGDHDMA